MARKRKLNTGEERDYRLSELLLRSIENHLNHVNYFNREDLVQLRIFQHVATTTRISLVGRTVRLLINHGHVVELTKTDLCLHGKESLYDNVSLADQYEATVSKLCSATADQIFDIMAIVVKWRTDSHLTVNNKRVAVRICLPRLIKAGMIEKVNDLEYQLK